MFLYTQPQGVDRKISRRGATEKTRHFADKEEVGVLYIWTSALLVKKNVELFKM